MDALHGRWLNGWRKILTATTQECCEQYWTSPGGNTPTKQQLYGHLPPITKTIKVRRTRDAGRCWRSRDELISDVLLWTPSHGRVKAGWQAQTYIQQLCEDMGCSPEDLPEGMNDRDEWREKVRDICPGATTRWWWLLSNTNNLNTVVLFQVFLPNTNNLHTIIWFKHSSIPIRYQ